MKAMTKMVPALCMDGIIVTITHSPVCWGLPGGPQTPLHKNTVLKHFSPEIVVNCLPQRNLYVLIHDPLKASEEERNLNDGKLWTWFGSKLLQRSDSTLTHEVIKLPRTFQRGDIVFAAPSPSSYYPQPLSVSQPRPQSEFEAPAVMWRITSLFQTAAGMFLEQPQGKDGLYVLSLWQPVDNSTKRGAKHLTSSWLCEERSDGLFTAEEEEKENKSRKSRRNKSAMPAVL